MALSSVSRLLAAPQNLPETLRTNETQAAAHQARSE